MVKYLIATLGILVGCKSGLSPEDAKDIAEHQNILAACESLSDFYFNGCVKTCEQTKLVEDCKQVCGYEAYNIWLKCLREHNISP